MTQQQFVYSSAVFDVSNIEAAKNIILTPEGGTTEERWTKETPYLADLIASKVKLTADSVVVDYGCGIGRLSKALIEQHGCKVIGIDISPSMRALGAVYVGHPHFASCAPEMLPVLGVKADLVLAVWVLQHCLVPKQDIANIRSVIADDGALFVLNNLGRAVPTLSKQWVDDGIDIDELIHEGGFKPDESGQLPSTVAPEGLARNTLWRTYRRAE